MMKINGTTVTPNFQYQASEDTLRAYNDEMIKIVNEALKQFPDIKLQSIQHPKIKSESIYFNFKVLNTTSYLSLRTHPYTYEKGSTLFHIIYTYRFATPDALKLALFRYFSIMKESAYHKSNKKMPPNPKIEPINYMNGLYPIPYTDYPELTNDANFKRLLNLSFYTPQIHFYFTTIITYYDTYHKIINTELPPTKNHKYYSMIHDRNSNYNKRISDLNDSFNTTISKMNYKHRRELITLANKLNKIYPSCPKITPTILSRHDSATPYIDAILKHIPASRLSIQNKDTDIIAKLTYDNPAKMKTITASNMDEALYLLNHSLSIENPYPKLKTKKGH